MFYFTANASSLLILFKYARVETTCHFLTLLSEIGVFRVFDRDFPFGISSSVKYFTIMALFSFLSIDTESIKFRSSSQVWWVAKF